MSFSNQKKRNPSMLWAFRPFIIVAAVVVFFGCVPGNFASEDTAERLLTTNGFTHIKLISQDPYFVGLKGCGKGDVAIFKFNAINPAGKTVTVDVCQGWPLKGATIRSL